MSFGIGRVVLVVEDDPLVRRMMVTSLTKAGFTTLEAGDAGAALRTCGSHPGAVDIALLDVFLPGSDGPALFEQLRKIRPDLRVIYTSGFMVAEVGDAPFIQKPYPPRQLAAAVAGALDPSPRPETELAA